MSKNSISERAISLISSNELTKFTVSDSKHMLEVDARQEGFLSDEFQSDMNILLYCACANTWYYLVQELNPSYARSLRRALMTRGLIAVIRLASDASDQLLSSGSTTVVPFNSWVLPTQPDEWGRLIQTLRYPKRLSPLGCNELSTKAIADLQQLENRTKLLQRHERPLWLVKRCNAILEELFCDLRLQDLPNGSFSSGSAHIPLQGSSGVGFTSNNIAAKVSYLHKVDSGLFPGLTEPCYIPFDESVVIRDVPKNFKSRRIIAMPNARNAYHMQGIRSWIRRYYDSHFYDYHGCVIPLTDLISLGDQNRNRYLAALGSSDGSVATIDLTSASDSIACSLAMDILPKAVVKECMKYRNTHAYYPSPDGPSPQGTPYCKTPRLIQMWLTSGDPMTYDSESLIFVSVLLAAMELGWNYGLIDDPQKIHLVSSVGDDLTCPSEVAPLVVELLGKLGFLVNEEKSYLTCTALGQYRESCGLEALDGHDVSPMFYSRKTPDNRAELVASFCALQHRLYHHHQLACEWLTDMICALEPQMTTSKVGTDCDDLWETVDHPIKVEYDRSLLMRKRCTADELSKLELYTLRERHLVLSQEVVANVKSRINKWRFNVSVSSRVDYEGFLYQEFLRNGPNYACELDRLLGVSLPPVKYEQAVQPMESIWRRVFF